jgi:hypothetical protein
MSSQTGPIYEASFFIDRDIADDFSLWLEEHIRDALRVDGVLECNTYVRADDDVGRARRACQYVLADNSALDRFLDGIGGDIDNELEAHFGEQVDLEARVLREDSREGVSGGTPDCLNCGAYMRGQYCAVCGQRAHSRLISLWELVRDAFGDLFELDSRLWQTLIPLLLRPGKLTHDYLQGRRARYMPPFRMYLVLSLLFFVVAFFDPREDLSLLFEPQPEPETGEAVSEAEEEVSAAEAHKEEILRELAEDGIIGGHDLPEDIELSEGFNIRIGDTETEEDCKVEATDLDDLPAWLQRRLTPERLQRICERTQIDGGRAFLDKLIDNIPAALIILLPLMAFVLKALYPLSRRYYVEHLLFFVHFHAFFFLILSLQILMIRVGSWLSIPEAIPILAVVAAAFYIPIHLFVAMRRVYGQGRFVTFLKYILLVIAYLCGFIATMLGAVAIAAISV